MKAINDNYYTIKNSFKTSEIENLNRSYFNLQVTSTQSVQPSKPKKVNSMLLKSGEENLPRKERGRLWIESNLDNPKNIEIDDIYTPWTRWSGCRKKCKQRRKRFCTMPTICGSNVLRVSLLFV